MITPLRDYTKIEEQNCQLVTDYGGKKFSNLYNVTTGPDDEVVSADRGNNEIIIFDKDLKLIRAFGQGEGDSKLNSPLGVAVGHHTIVVSEDGDHVVKKYSLQGDYLSKFGTYGSGDGQFNKPKGLCFNSKGLLYIVDYNNGRVQVFREDDVFLFKFCSISYCPWYIVVDSSDQVYVTDYSDYSTGGICVFSPHGNFIKKIKFNRPWAIDIAPDDYIIIDDHVNCVLTVFSPTHELIGKLGVCGKEKGQFNNVRGMAINNSGTIFVVESENHRLRLLRTS